MTFCRAKDSASASRIKMYFSPYCRWKICAGRMPPSSKTYKGKSPFRRAKTCSSKTSLILPKNSAKICKPSSSQTKTASTKMLSRFNNTASCSKKIYKTLIGFWKLIVPKKSILETFRTNNRFLSVKINKCGSFWKIWKRPSIKKRPNWGF